MGFLPTSYQRVPETNHGLDDLRGPDELRWLCEGRIEGIEEDRR